MFTAFFDRLHSGFCALTLVIFPFAVNSSDSF